MFSTTPHLATEKPLEGEATEKPPAVDPAEYEKLRQRTANLLQNVKELDVRTQFGTSDIVTHEDTLLVSILKSSCKSLNSGT